MRTLRTALAMACGLAPGVLLPFAIALTMTVGNSDITVLVCSLSVVLMNVIVASVESASIAVLGATGAKRPANQTASAVAQPLAERAPSARHALSRRGLLRFTLRNVLLAAPAVLIASAILVSVFWGSVTEQTEFAIGVSVLALVSIIGSASAVFAGGLIAEGRTFVPIFSQGFRSLFPIAGLLLSSEATLLLVALLAVCGELCRMLALAALSFRSEPGLLRLDTEPPRPAGLYWQFASTSFTQANPVIDKYVLGAADPGSLTAYELADKVSFATFQAAYNFGLLQRIGSWAQGQGLERRRRFRSDVLRLMLATLALALITASILALLLVVEVLPRQWQLGAQWAILACFAMPLAIGVTASMRYLVMLRLARWLLPISVFGVLVNAVLDLVFFLAIGPIGVVLASIPARLALFLGFQGVIYLAEQNAERRMTPTQSENF